jgi:hypothetical protein
MIDWPRQAAYFYGQSNQPPINETILLHLIPRPGNLRHLRPIIHQRIQQLPTDKNRVRAVQKDQQTSHSYPHHPPPDPQNI